MPGQVRVLELPHTSDAVAELERIGVDPATAPHTATGLLNCVVRIDGLPADAAAILAPAVDVIAGAPQADGSVPFLLAGTRLQIDRALHYLRHNSLYADSAALAQEKLGRWSTGPTLPDQYSLEPRLAKLFGAIGQRTLVMGILNVTPDSFSDGGRFSDRDAAVQRALQMVEEGADILDVGGESTRPGADPVPAEEEIDRVVPVISEVSRGVAVPISIDTCKARVAEAALAAGAVIVNDVSAASADPNMPALLAEAGCPAVLMHMRGTPRNMRDLAQYDDLMAELYGHLAERVEAVVRAGVDERMLIVDPGIGFAKTVAHNLEILRRLGELRSLGRPILVGTSRKFTIGAVLGNLPPEERMEGTIATIALSIANGADIVRVHDVRAMARAAKMTDAVVRANYSPG